MWNLFIIQFFAITWTHLALFLVQKKRDKILFYQVSFNLWVNIRNGWTSFLYCCSYASVYSNDIKIQSKTLYIHNIRRIMGKKSFFIFNLMCEITFVPLLIMLKQEKGQIILFCIFFYEFLIELPDVWIFVYGMKQSCMIRTYVIRINFNIKPTVNQRSFPLYTANIYSDPFTKKHIQYIITSLWSKRTIIQSRSDLLWILFNNECFIL